MLADNAALRLVTGLEPQLRESTRAGQSCLRTVQMFSSLDLNICSPRSGPAAGLKPHRPFQRQVETSERAHDTRF